MPQPIIEVQNLSKKYQLGRVGATTLREDLGRTWARIKGAESSENEGAFWALRDVSFSVQPGETVGIMGSNGAGKSTLLKILSRITEPTAGRATLRGRVSSLLEVGTGFHPELTGRENVYLNGAILGMKRAEIDALFDEIVAFAEINQFIDTPVKRYSSGMRVRLAFAVAAHLDSEIMIVDEVLAVGDMSFQQKCLGKMGDISRSGRTIFFVSHHLASVESLCSTAIVLNKGRVSFHGSQIDGMRHYLEQVLNTMPSSEVILPISTKSRPLELRSIHILNATDGKPSDAHINTGDDVTFVVKCRSNEPGKHFTIGIGIHTKNNERLLTLHTKCDPAFNWDALPGEIILTCMVKRLPLSSGRYPLMLACATGNEIIEMHRDLMALQVFSGDFFGNGGAAVGGIVNLEQIWAVEPNPRV